MANETISREDLVNSFSRHAKLTNRYMLGILLCSVIYILNLNPGDSKIVLPFIGEINKVDFHLMTFSLISCLIILFSSSHLMALRVREYYNIFFDNYNDRDYFDLIVEPTIFRMAPISWMMKNKKIFEFNKNDINKKWKIFESGFYALLKFLVLLIAYIFPMVVLIIGIINTGIFDFSNDIIIIFRLLLIFLAVLSFSSFFVVVITEIYFIYRTLLKIF